MKNNKCPLCQLGRMLDDAEKHYPVANSALSMIRVKFDALSRRDPTQIEAICVGHRSTPLDFIAACSSVEGRLARLDGDKRFALLAKRWQGCRS